MSNVAEARFGSWMSDVNKALESRVIIPAVRDDFRKKVNWRQLHRMGFRPGDAITAGLDAYAPPARPASQYGQ